MEGPSIINDSNSDDQTNGQGIITFNIDIETAKKMSKILNLLGKFVQLSDNLGLPLQLIDIIINMLESGIEAADTLYSALQIARITDEQSVQLDEFTQQVANGQIFNTGLTHAELFNILRLLRIITSRTDKVDELVEYMKNAN